MLGGDGETWISGTVLELVPEARLFRALADPTRRRLLDLLAGHGTLRAVGAVPGLVTSGISKHPMALRAAGPVTAQRQGRHPWGGQV